MLAPVPPDAAANVSWVKALQQQGNVPRRVPLPEVFVGEFDYGSDDIGESQREVRPVRPQIGSIGRVRTLSLIHI